MRLMVLRTVILAAWVVGAPGFASSEVIRTYTNVDVTAHAVVEVAIEFWEALLPDTFTFSLAVERAPLGSTLAFSSDFVEAAAAGLPVSARITIDDGSGGIPWFVDDTPDDDLEYRRGQNPYHALAAGAGPAAGFDLLTVLQHELAHAFGFSVFYSAFAEHVAQASDGNRTYTGAAVTARITGAGAGTHTLPQTHPYDLMNPELEAGVRFSPSSLDLAILQDAFGYAVSAARPLQPAVVPEPRPMLLAPVALLAVLARRARLFG